MAPNDYCVPMTFTESTDQDLRTYAEAFNDEHQGLRPDVEPEDRTYVEYNDVEQVSDADRHAVAMMDGIASHDEPHI